MSEAYRRAIAIMAKAPFAGEAKTRLAAAIGGEAAAGLHRVFLAQSMATAHAVADSLGDTLVALVCPNPRHAAALEELATAGVEVWTQERPGLMAGISDACERALAKGAQAVLVTEADSPTLPAAHLLRSFRLLLGTTPAMVLGPCADGGYYLAGVSGLSSAEVRDVFEGEAYAGATICEDTAARGRRLGLRVEAAPEWYDVDTIDDLRRLRDELRGVPDGQFEQLQATRTTIDELTLTNERAM